jgi:hypothetical protein
MAIVLFVEQSLGTHINLQNLQTESLENIEDADLGLTPYRSLQKVLMVHLQSIASTFCSVFE